MHACTHDPPRANLPTHTYIGRAGKLNASTPLGGGFERRTRRRTRQGNSVSIQIPVFESPVCHLSRLVTSPPSWTPRAAAETLFCIHMFFFGFPPSSLTHAPLSTLRHQCVMMSQRGGLLAFIGTSRSCGIEFMQEWFICFFTGLAF